jgi:hypothetical protein
MTLTGPTLNAGGSYATFMDAAVSGSVETRNLAVSEQATIGGGVVVSGTATISTLSGLSSLNGLVVCTNTTISSLCVGGVSSVAGVVAIGPGAGDSGTGAYLTSIGVNAGSKNTGTYVNAMGSSAADHNIGRNVVAIGMNAAKTNAGNYNVNIGDFSGMNQTGSSNVGLGMRSLVGNGGSLVTALGFSAGEGSGANHCVYIGERAGMNNTLSNSVFIGRNSGGYTPDAPNTFMVYSTKPGVPAVQVDTSNNVMGIGCAPNPKYGLAVGGPIANTINVVCITTTDTFELSTSNYSTYFNLLSSSVTSVILPGDLPIKGSYWVIKNNSTAAITLVCSGGSFNTPGTTSTTTTLPIGGLLTLIYSGADSVYYTF